MKRLTDVPVRSPGDIKYISLFTGSRYLEMPHQPQLPAVRETYDVVKRELLEQYQWLKDNDFRVLPWPREGQPYAGSPDLFADALLLGKVYVYRGGELPADHPLSEFGPDGLTYNEVFRGVHDYLGHAAKKLPLETLAGELAAYREHSRVFFRPAWPALFTETVGQTAAFYHGGGKFPEQKAGIVEVR